MVLKKCKRLAVLRGIRTLLINEHSVACEMSRFLQDGLKALMSQHASWNSGGLVQHDMQLS